jgi:hypothetical protein
MSKFRRTMTAFLAPVVSTLMLTSCSMAESGPLDRVACDIRITGGDDGVRIEPIAISSFALSGDYEFAVVKESSGGTSESTQAGEFKATAGQPEILSAATLDSEGSVTARLTLRWDGGHTWCEKSYP